MESVDHQTWNLDSYARFKEQQNESQIQRSNSGTWQQLLSTMDRPLVIRLLKPLSVVIQSANDVLESFSVADSKKWLKVIMKNDNILFFYKSMVIIPELVNSTVRRFRVKFSTESSKPSIESCKEFVQSISPYVSVQKVDHVSSQASLPSSQIQPLEITTTADSTTTTDSHQTSQTAKQKTVTRKSIASISCAVASNKLDALPAYMRSTNIDIGEESLENQIKLCLMDSNFPGFVEQVEKVLKSISEDDK